MMTKNETLNHSWNITSLSPFEMMKVITRTLAQRLLFKKLAQAYTFLLDEEVSSEQAVYYFYAQVLFMLILLPINYGSGWRMCMFILTCISTRAAMGNHFAENE